MLLPFLIQLLPTNFTADVGVVALFLGQKKFISDKIRVVLSDCEAVQDALLAHRASILKPHL